MHQLEARRDLRTVRKSGAQGRGSHSAEGANAPPTFGPVAPRWEYAPPTFPAAKRLYRSHGDLKWSSWQCSLQKKCKSTKHDNQLDEVEVAT